MRRTALAHAFDCRAIGTDDRATRRRQPSPLRKIGHTLPRECSSMPRHDKSVAPTHWSQCRLRRRVCVSLRAAAELSTTVQDAGQANKRMIRRTRTTCANPCFARDVDHLFIIQSKFRSSSSLNVPAGGANAPTSRSVRNRARGGFVCSRTAASRQASAI